MILGATPRELALVGFLLVLVVIHSVVPRIGERIGGLFEKKGEKAEPPEDEEDGPGQDG